MVRQYPYTLWIKSIAANAVANASGNYSGQSTTWTQVSLCRDEANSQGQSVTLEDGKTSVFDSLIQLPKSCPVLAAGTDIEVRDGSSVRVSGTVKRFQQDQLHSRAWI